MGQRTNRASEGVAGSAAAPSAISPTLETWLGAQDSGITSLAPVSVPALTILYHPQLDRVGAQALLHELSSGEPILLSRVAPEFSSRARPTPEPLADPSLSRGPLWLTPIANGGVRLDIRDARA